MLAWGQEGFVSRQNVFAKILVVDVIANYGEKDVRLIFLRWAKTTYEDPWPCTY